MSATVIEFWQTKQAEKIRIPGPGEERHEPAKIIDLRHRPTPLAPVPQRKKPA